MTAYIWTQSVICLLGILISIYRAGKPREPLSNGSVAFSVLINIGFILWGAALLTSN